MAMASNNFDIAIRRNPHLKEYIADFQKKYGTVPEFHDQVSRDMGSIKEPNILYPVGDPIFIHVFGSKETGRRYIAIEPILDELSQKKMKEVLEQVFYKAGYREATNTKTEFERLVDSLYKESIKVVDSEDELDKPPGFAEKLGPKKVRVTQRQETEIKYHIKRNIIELGIMEPLIRDPYIEDIHHIGLDNITVIHKIFDALETNINFGTMENINEFYLNVSERIGKPVSVSRPIIDSALPDGSRLNMIYADDVSTRGPSFTVRKFSAEPLSCIQLIKWNTWSIETGAYIWLSLEYGMNMFVCGETASGKTTTLNGALPMIRRDSKIFTVEDTAEVLPPHRIWQQLITRESGPEESRVTMFDLLKAALRSRPNYIIVGEIRGQEGAIAFQAMQTGHPVMSTFHAASVTKMIQRFTGDPINVPIRFMDNLNVALIQQAVYQKGRVLRRVTSIGEILGYSKELDGVLTKDVFRWDPVTDLHKFRGRNNSYVMEGKIAEMMGLEDKREIYKEFDLRAKVLKIMADRDIVSYDQVNDIIQQFQLWGVEGLPFPV